MGLQRSRSSDDRQSSFTLHLECVDDKSIIKIPLTQVGLQFDNSLLRTEEIEYAHDVLEYHVRRNNRLNESVASEPVIISQAGVIRNGTLMMYRSMMQKISDRTIKTDAELDQELASMIAEGRRARGPHFIDSTRQLSELRFALRKQLDVERQRAMNKQTTNKVSEIQYAERA